MAKRRKGVYKRGRIWWIAYYRNGKLHQESSRSTRLEDANELIDKRRRETGPRTGRELERVTFAQLADDLLAYYDVNELRSKSRVEHALKHLRPAFGAWRAVDLTSDAIRRYAADRKAEGASHGTVNRELSYLRRALRLGHHDGKVANVPHVEMLREDNTRDGFVEPGQMAALLRELPRHHEGWVEVAYVTGWRKRACLSRRWEHVEGDDLVLDVEASKNRRTYRWPLRDGEGELTALGEAVQRQREYVEALGRMRDKVIPWLFCYPDGRRIKHPDEAFKKAAERAGLSDDLLIHDLRRSAVRNLSMKGVPETVIMEMCGMETRSIFDRYNISDDARRREAAARLTSARQEKPERGKVRRIGS